MSELPRTIPGVKMLLALAPEELGSTILFRVQCPSTMRDFWS